MENKQLIAIRTQLDIDMGKNIPENPYTPVPTVKNDVVRSNESKNQFYLSIVDDFKNI